MKIKLYNEPIPHIIIDNIFDDEQYQRVWKELQYLAPNMVGPDGTHAAKDPKELENGNTEFTFRKRGVGIFLEAFFKNPYQHSEIAKTYSSIFNDPKVFEEIYEQSPFFLMFKNVNNTSLLVQKYNNSDEYASHKDEGVFTMVTLLYKEPKAYSGGDFCFTEFGKTYTVPLSNNQSVIFCSAIEHKVTQVISESNEIEDSRFTIAAFMGMK